MNKIRNLIISTFTAVILGIQSTYAATILPDFLQKFFSGDFDPVEFLTNRLQTVFLLLIGVFIIIVIFQLINSFIKFSQDEDEKGFGDAVKIIQQQLIAIGAVFVGVLGIALVFYFMGERNIVQPHAICLSEPDSYGCYACNNSNRPSKADEKKNLRLLCEFCDENPNITLRGINKKCNEAIDIEEFETQTKKEFATELANDWQPTDTED